MPNNPNDSIIDGSLTLAQTLSAIRFKEAGGYEMTSLIAGVETLAEKDGEKPLNYAAFILLSPPGTLPKKLELVETGDDLGAVLAKRAADGWKLICCNPVFVKSKLKTVAAFRKA
ncbi:MAG: hypothetical protein K2W85_11235 [Phycisphaerales bacterium]|nr:hypothetical protein [Phycisphaerales bacterium]